LQREGTGARAGWCGELALRNAAAREGAPRADACGI
jgi:hypothetical protein